MVSLYVCEWAAVCTNSSLKFLRDGQVFPPFWNSLIGIRLSPSFFHPSCILSLWLSSHLMTMHSMISIMIRPHTSHLCCLSAIRDLLKGTKAVLTILSLKSYVQFIFKHSPEQDNKKTWSIKVLNQNFISIILMVILRYTLLNSDKTISSWFALILLRFEYILEETQCCLDCVQWQHNPQTVNCFFSA